MVIHCILTGLLVYYIALWLWYRYTDSRTSPGRTDDAPLPRNGVSGYTLIGESRYKGRQIGTAQDKSGHLPQATENDTIFAPQADVQPEENISEAAAEAEETPGYENDEPDYEDEEIAGYDAVVENINGGLAKVAELLGRNEAELATVAVPAEAGNTGKEHEAFDMNDFL